MISMGLVAACGGGGESGDGGSGPLFVSDFGYTGMSGYAGEPVSASPRGEPAVGGNRFTATGLPPGTTINGSTGTISGTPTQPGNYPIVVTLTVDGYSGSLTASWTTQIAPARNFRWSRQTNQVLPDLLRYEVASIGSTLYLVGTTRTAPYSLQTWRSTNQGLAWTQLSVAPNVALEHFAMASDGASIYLSGGRDPQSRLNTSQVWRFDGSNWTSVAVTSPFPARRRHAMTFHGGALYVTAGVADNGYTGSDALVEGTGGSLNDVWRSTNGGVTWMAQTGAAAFTPRFGHCSTSFNGQLYVMGGFSGRSYFNQPFEIWRSADGVTWTLGASVVDSVSEYQVYGACAVFAGKLVYTGGTTFALGTSTVQAGTSGRSRVRVSTDGLEWSSEAAQTAEGFNAFGDRWNHGMVVLGSSLFVVGGWEDVGSFSFDHDIWKTP